MSTFDRIDPRLVDVFPEEHDGYPDHLAAEDTTDALRDACGDAARDFPAAMFIDPKDWADRARDNDKYGRWAVNYVDRFTNQNPSHECTCHSLRTNFESARNRARAVQFADGPRKDFRYVESTWSGSVWVSPLSVYAEANPDEWGGANVRQVLEIAVRRGILPDRIQPAEYHFKHVLQGTSGEGNTNQSGGGWIPVSKFPAGWQETARHFRPLEVIFPSSYEEAVCCVLHGLAVSVGRNGHAVPWCKWMAGERAMLYPDSYNVTRYDSESTARSAWRGSFAIASTTVPDDWSRPAG